MNDDKENESGKEFPNFDPTKDLFQAGQRSRKRGLGAKPLTEHEIKKAQKKARSAMEAARILGVAYKTYKKYAKMYGIFEDLKNPKGYGISKGYNKSKGSPHSLEDILKGEHPSYPPHRLKDRLLGHGYMEEQCDNCGFDERRITDHKVPLVLDYLDGDRSNHKFENLRILCYNCSYLINGNLMGPKKTY